MLKKIIDTLFLLGLISIFLACESEESPSLSKINTVETPTPTPAPAPTSTSTPTPTSPSVQANEDKNTSIIKIDTSTLPKELINDEFHQESYNGLKFYYKNLYSDNYKLEQLNDNDFANLNKQEKLQVANKLLSSLFFGYPYKELQKKIDNGDFISAIRSALEEDKIDRDNLETLILNNDIFRQYTNSPWIQSQVVTILTRFYAMDTLDRYYFENWMAYILAQTIMFSPAYELSSTHTPNISRVYNRLVNMLDINSGMRYISYVHMMSEDNWRRFRSPEDNGREMLEIFTLDTNDSHVPLAGKALQNWKLNKDGNTLEVGLNKNHTPISLFGTTIYNGDDFYRELVKSTAFTYGVTKRLVDFFFPQKDENRRAEISKIIVSSKPEKWQDILLQILFSKEYLLQNSRVLSAEERFYSFAKIMQFKAKRDTFYHLKKKLTNMHQASMRYKLGKLERVPLDSLSFSSYHKYIREYMLLNIANEHETNRDSWKYDGWSKNFISTENFKLNEKSSEETLRNFINYLFMSMISREATDTEMALFKSHILEEKNGKVCFKSEFNMVTRRDENEEEERLKRRKNLAVIILDYISRVENTYIQREVK